MKKPKNQLYLILIIIMCSLSIVSCKSNANEADSTAVQEIEDDSDTEETSADDQQEDQQQDQDENYQSEIFGVIWPVVISDTLTNLSQQYYEEIALQDIIVDEAAKTIYFLAFLKEEADPACALEYIESALIEFNECAQAQNETISSSVGTYMGGVYDSYNISVGIAPDSAEIEEDQYYINTTLNTGNIIMDNIVLQNIN